MKEDERVKVYQQIYDLTVSNNKKGKEIERLHSIIKEVREYIKNACWLDEVNKPNALGHKQTIKVLEILDKVGDIK